MVHKRAGVVLLITMVGCSPALPITPPTPGASSTSPTIDEIRVDGPDGLRQALALARPG